MKNKILKEKKLKNKFLAVSMASLILMSSFPVTSPVYALANEALDGVTQATENDSNILKELTKDANAEQLVIRDRSFTYKLKVFVNKNANFVEGIVDETDTVNGVYGNIAMIWGQFKGENKGLKKYGGKTFGEIKAMQTPDDIIVMGGRDDIPKKVHNKILEFIAREDAKEGKAEREKKNELARSLYKHRYRYVYKNTQIWDAATLSQFLESYNKAREVLEKPNPSENEISERISDLEKKYKAIKAAPFSDAKFKELVRQAEEKIKNKDSYTLSTMAELQRVLSEVRNDFNAGKIKNLLDMNKAEEKLKKALDQLVTKEESKKRFTINGEVLQYGNENEKSMANQFMDPSVLLIEEDNAKIYEVTFKKGTFQGITAEVEGIKYDRENGSWQDASLVNTVNDTKTFRLVMSKSDIDKIHIKTQAYMGGPDLSEQDAVLKLNLSTKRPEGSQLEEGNKKKLKEFLDSIQELNKDVNDGLYQDPESSQFAKRYVEATKLLEANQVTDDAIESMIRSIKIAKQDLVLKAVKEFTDKLIKAEGITTDKSSKEKYTEKSLAKLQEAVDAGNAVWATKNKLQKEELARLINLLDTAIADLKQKGQEEENHSTEGKVFTAPVTLMHASNPTQKSMANGAIVSPAKLIYNGDKVTVELEFKGLDLKGMKGHITNLFNFENNTDPKIGGQAVETKIEKKFMDVGIDGKEKEFPQVFSFTMDRNLFESSEFLWCRVWVDVMDLIMGGTPGAGAKEAKIVIDKTNLPKEEPLNKEELTNLINEARAIEKGDKTEEAFNKLQEAIKRAQESIDKIKSKENLENAKNELQKAIKEFKASPVEVKEAKNKPELEKLLQEQEALYKDILNGEYKEEGSKLYLDKHKEALKLLEDSKAKEEDIDNIIRSLKSIRQNRLVLRILDVFQDLLAKAEKITNNGNTDKKYTEDSFNKLKEAVVEANKYWNNRFEQPKDKIESLNTMLKEGIAGLKEVEKTDLKKEALKTEIENAKNIEQGKKTEEAFTKLQEAITAAKKVLEEATDQNQLDQEVETLKGAVKTFNESKDKVVPTPLEKEELTKEIAAARSVKQGKKTEEAFNTLKAAIKSAEEVLNSASEQTQLDEAVKTLKAAVKAFNESADKEVTPLPEPRPNPNPSPQEKPEVDPGKKPEKRPEVSPEKKTNTKPEPYFPSFPSYRRSSDSSSKNEGRVYVGSPKATKDLVKKEEVKNSEAKASEIKKTQNNTNSENFTDTKDHWAKKAIDYVVNKGYFSGISEKEFGPNKAITRGQFVTVLGRILNINVDDFKANKFKDVDSSQYYAAYVSWAASVGITKGRGNGNFDPNKEITREEMAVMMEKFLNVAGKNLGEVENTKKFKDEGKIQSWAQDSVKKMTKLGLINGMEDGSFSPKSSFTRGQVAQILYNMDNK